MFKSEGYLPISRFLEVADGGSIVSLPNRDWRGPVVGQVVTQVWEGCTATFRPAEGLLATRCIIN